MNEADTAALEMAKTYLDKLMSILEQSQKNQLIIMDKLVAAGVDLHPEQFSALLGFYNSQSIMACNTITVIMDSFQVMVGSACQAIVAINTQK